MRILGIGLAVLIVLLLVLAGAAYLVIRNVTGGAPEAGRSVSERIESPYISGDDRFVEAAGQYWRVRSSGPPDAPAVVLIHGFGHSLEDFEPWAEMLDDAYTVIRFDLPGHGLTGPREDAAYANEAAVEQVEALLEIVAPDRFVIGGNSLGGLLAWRYAARNPERTDGVILLAPGGFSINGVTDEPVSPPLPVRLYLQGAPQAGVEAATAALFADPARIPAGMTARVGDMMREPGVGDALVQRIEQFTLPDPRADLARIADPVLLIWGAQDSFIPATQAQDFQGAINAPLETLIMENTGHMPQLERPIETAATARDFLDTHAGPPYPAEADPASPPAP